MFRCKPERSHQQQGGSPFGGNANRFLLQEQLQGDDLRYFDEAAFVLLAYVMPKVRTWGFAGWHRGDRLSRIERLQLSVSGQSHAVALQARLLTLEAADVRRFAVSALDRPCHQRMAMFDPSRRFFLVCLFVSRQHWSSLPYPPAPIVPFLASTALP
jgi:hypothetical protein